MGQLRNTRQMQPDVTGRVRSQASAAKLACVHEFTYRMKQFLAVQAIGKDRPGLAHEIVRIIADCGASLAESRMLPLGAELAMQMLVGGNWHSMARLESELTRLAESSGLALTLRRTEARGLREDHIPYSVDVIGPDHPGIVAGLTGFFASRQVEIGEIATRSYVAQQTGALMFAVQMGVNVPTRLHIAQLREDFMDYCDSQNLDAILEPVKN